MCQFSLFPGMAINLLLRPRKRNPESNSRKYDVSHIRRPELSTKSLCRVGLSKWICSTTYRVSSGPTAMPTSNQPRKLLHGCNDWQVHMFQPAWGGRSKVEPPGAHAYLCTSINVSAIKCDAKITMWSKITELGKIANAWTKNHMSEQIYMGFASGGMPKHGV